MNLSRNYLDIIINKENNTHYIEDTMYASYDVSGFVYWMIKLYQHQYRNKRNYKQ